MKEELLQTSKAVLLTVILMYMWIFGVGLYLFKIYKFWAGFNLLVASMSTYYLSLKFFKVKQ